MLYFFIKLNTVTAISKKSWVLNGNKLYSSIYSPWCGTQLHSRLWQDPDIQQGASWVESVLQCPHAAWSIHCTVWSDWWEP